MLKRIFEVYLCQRFKTLYPNLLFAMKNVLQIIPAAAFVCLSFISCSTEEMASSDTSLNAVGTTLEVNEITAADLEGQWNMYAMTSNIAVDFDDTDTIKSTDILSETTCFDPMFFTFKSDGNVVTDQARLFFDATSGMFSCQTTGNYTAQYDVLENQLTVTFTVDGNQYTETKTITRYSENGNEFLEVTLTESETDGAVYVANDPGTTVASDIQEINMTYIKEVPQP